MAALTRRLRYAAVGVLAIAFFGGALLYLYYPAKPHSVLGWLVLFAVGLPTWAFLEWLGDAVLNNQWFGRLSSPARIALGVPAVLVLTAVGSALIILGGLIIRRL